MKGDNPKITRNENKKKQREFIPSNSETKPPNVADSSINWNQKNHSFKLILLTVNINWNDGINSLK